MILRTGKRCGVLVLALVVVAVMAPQVAWACPACALRDDGGIAATVILAVMMILPFGLTGLVVYVLRKAIAKEEKHILADYEPAGGEQRA